MKYFTTEWWESGCDDAPSLFKQYDSYIDSVRSLLPVKLANFDNEHTLHDSEVKSIVCDFEQNVLTIVLNGWNLELEYPVRYTLYFSGVTVFNQELPKQEYVESELGDLGYWEFEALKPLTEVRMLFVSTAEFRIVFKTLILSMLA